MSKRGNQGCPRYCTNCGKDCRCEHCNYCHTCYISNAYHHNNGNHTWRHTCTTPDPQPLQTTDIWKFLRDTSERFSQFCVSEVYTIKIGDDRTYYVHEEALRQKSPVFKKHLELEMKEKSTRTIELNDVIDKEPAFVPFIQFCYFGSYGYDDVGKDDGFQKHALVYVFAEKFEILELKSLALKKATLLCSRAIEDSSAASLIKVLQFALLETVPIVYGGTYDSNTGKYPTALEEKSGSDTIAIKTVNRDGFRMLLSKFSARYIEQLRQNENFMKIFEEYPSFGMDILLFTGAASEFSTDGKGCLKF